MSATRPSDLPSAAPARGCWIVTDVAASFDALRLLWRLLPAATEVVTLGGRRSWYAASGATTETMLAVGPNASLGEQRLPYASRTMDLLVLAAHADAPAPFCDELRVFAGDTLLLRWLEPTTGPLRLWGGAPPQLPWQLAQHLHAQHRWELAAL